MDSFLTDAESILDTAVSAVRSGNSPTEMVILTGVRGGVQILAECDWPLESIRTERSATSAYRVFAQDSVVVVEGRQQGRTCRLQQSLDGSQRFAKALGAAVALRWTLPMDKQLSAAACA